jgi:hypothetical protein
MALEPLQPARWRAPYRIETARLNLRALGPEHVDQLHLDGILRESEPSGSGELEDKMVWSLLASEYPRHALYAAPRPVIFDVLGRQIGRAASSPKA